MNGYSVTGGFPLGYGNRTLQFSGGTALNGRSGAKDLGRAEQWLVDDDEEIRNLLSRYLTAQGVPVSLVMDGRSMEECLATASADLVVLDMILPDARGLDLCRCTI